MKRLILLIATFLVVWGASGLQRYCFSRALAGEKVRCSGWPCHAISGMVRVEEIDPLIVIDIRYGSVNNFTGKQVYPGNIALLQKDTAVKLAAANAELVERGLRIKLWDAYRPIHLHRFLWEMAGEKSYFFADPLYGSIHNRGAAVDVTMVDARGQEVEMPSDFDDFSSRAHRQSQMSPAARANLDLLTEVMARNGFMYIDFEWWHFEDSAWRQYPALDIPLTDEVFVAPQEFSKGPGGCRVLGAESPAKTVIPNLYLKGGKYGFTPNIIILGRVNVLVGQGYILSPILIVCTRRR